MLKVCVVIASRANYGRAKSVMQALQDNPGVNLQIIVGASTLLDRFGRAVDVIKADGFKPNRCIHYVVEGESLVTQAKTTGLGIVEISSAFAQLKPHIVMTIADRFETMATAISAVYMNIPLVHIQGGEVSGNIDDRVRHGITKMADYHFVCTEQSKQRVLKMGEEPERVFNFGCPAMDILAKNDLSISNEEMLAYTGVGRDEIDWEKDYLLMIQHPVTTSYGQGRTQITTTLQALEKFKYYQKVVLWPNIDAGSDQVSKGIRVFREQGKAKNFRFFKNFSPEVFAKVLNNARCCVGNSSSFLREGSFLGVPTVLLGDRQSSREHGENIVFSSHKKTDIIEQLQHQLEHGRFPPSRIFGQGDAGQQIADTIMRLDLTKTKQMAY